MATSNLTSNLTHTHTARTYASAVRACLRWLSQRLGEPVAPEALTATDLREYVVHLQRSGRSPRTVNVHIAALKALGKQLAERGAPNPAAELRMVRVDQRIAPRALDSKTEHKLLRALDERVALATQRPERNPAWAIRDRAFTLLLLHTGLRVSEALALDIGDVQLGERSGSLRVRMGKGARARAVPLNRTARAALREWLAARETLGANIPALWLSQQRRRWSAQAVEHLFAELSQRIGARVTPHILRHTFATRLIRAGVGIERVAALLGHARLDATRIYTAPTWDELAADVERV